MPGIEDIVVSFDACNVDKGDLVSYVVVILGHVCVCCYTGTLYVCVVVYIHTCVVMQKAEISNEINWTSKVRTARHKVDPLSVLRFYTNTHTHKV